MENKTLSDNILLHSIKICDIGFINVMNVALAIIFAQIVDRVAGKFDEKEEEKNHYGN